MNTAAHQVYRQTQTHTARPGELVVMLYRGAIRFTAAAVAALEARDLEGSHNNLIKAQAIINELSASLKLDVGGEVAVNLARIYEYLERRLVEANVSKTAEPAREVEHHLRELLPAWEQAVRIAASQHAA